MAPREGEPVVVKSYPNSFVETDLDQRLKALHARNLVLAGFMTHMCVNSTARGAFNLGYAPTVVAAATATRTLPGVGGSRRARSHHAVREPGRHGRPVRGRHARCRGYSGLIDAAARHARSIVRTSREWEDLTCRKGGCA